jgi:hypothetical protein
MPPSLARDSTRTKKSPSEGMSVKLSPDLCDVKEHDYHLFHQTGVIHTMPADRSDI